MNLFRGLRPLHRAAALRDALAGVVMAAMDIPQVLGYSKIAGMPVVTGLYSLLLPLVAFAAFGSSRYLVVAADSATAAIFADGVSGTATPAGAQYVALAAIVAVLTAIILLLARLLRLGFIADFLSRTVLVGFLTAHSDLVAVGAGFCFVAASIRSQGSWRAGGCCGRDCSERSVEFCRTRHCDDWAGGCRFASPGIDGARQPARNEP